jgi:hypothetical protein
MTPGEREDKPGEAVEYQGYSILPQPKAQGSQFYTAGVITKEFPTGRKEHRFIRADTHTSHESACQHAVQKARQIIDEQGDRMFKD